MAQNSKKLDLSQPVATLAKDDPDLSALLAEIGFIEIPAGETLIELADKAGISPSIVTFSLEAAGYDLGNYTVPSDGFESPLPGVFDALFASRDSQLDASIASSDAPMLAHMEAAVHRAQKSGVLPTDERKADSSDN